MRVEKRQRNLFNLIAASRRCPHGRNRIEISEFKARDDSNSNLASNTTHPFHSLTVPLFTRDALVQSE